MIADQATNQATRGERLADLQKRLTGTQIIASAVGMLLLDSTWEEQRRPLRVGDRVDEGQVVANIIDPKNMRVSCDINAGDIERVKTGQKVYIRVPALGNKVVQGKIQAIGNLAREQSMWEGGTPGKQVFTAIIEVTSKEQRLRPGMSATVEILLAETKKSTLVPIEAVFPKGKGQCVYILRKGRYYETPVHIVSRNEIQASVTGSLHAGTRVACERPK
jgi:HlyD family secretion protein